MISAIMIFLDNGIPIYAAYFEPIEFDITFIAGFVSAVNIFGLKVFPNQDLEDIAFTKHHLMFMKFVVYEKPLIFLVIHEPEENHLELKKIVMEIMWALKTGYANAMRKPFIYPALFKPLDTAVERILANQRRTERLIQLDDSG